MNKFLFKRFIKNYQDIKNPEVRESYGKLAGMVGIVSNVFLCVMKIFMGLFVNSIAIIADGINNLADAASSIITLVGFKLAAMPEDREHPYGHARIEYLTGMLVSVLIIFLGIELFKTSVDKILHPAPLEFSYVTLAILGIAIAVKIWQSLFNVSTGKLINSVTLIATGMDSRNDVIATSAVLLGVIIGKITGFQLDGYMGCAVALFIVWSGIQLIRDTSSPLLGEAPDPDLVNSIVSCTENYPNVLGMHDLVVHSYGPGRTFASLHAEVDSEKDLMESHDMIDNLERELSSTLRIHAVVHMDPVKINDPIIFELHEMIKAALSGLPGVCSFHDLRIVPGETHTNVIFDVVTSYECTLTNEEIKDLAENALRRKNPNYYVVITFDKAYTAQ